ncbi:TetR/AcrR family transcriptional regulator [Anthocerotibacter panamensis]|uniref:TetR/AcrR family transcriptional regulator n=1 Tax=Anthocerotibacter panamensis TaxID=2857077 RepID=UPI001C405861|nr:TetR/AcrR family transcriptional regulator [Anthocerotibacter panamensis]
MPAPLHAREEVIDRLIGVFRQYGYEGASLTELSKATGLGRSSLYHYFPDGKDDMVRAALERLGQWLQREVVGPLQSGGPPMVRLQRMLTTLDQLYASGGNPCLLGSLVTGASRQRFQAQLQSAFTLWIEALATLLVEAGLPEDTAHERAEGAVVQIQGALVVGGGLGSHAPFERVLKRLATDLLLKNS